MAPGAARVATIYALHAPWALESSVCLAMTRLEVSAGPATASAGAVDVTKMGSDVPRLIASHFREDRRASSLVGKSRYQRKLPLAPRTESPAGKRPGSPRAGPSHAAAARRALLARNELHPRAAMHPKVGGGAQGLLMGWYVRLPKPLAVPESIVEEE